MSSTKRTIDRTEHDRKYTPEWCVKEFMITSGIHNQFTEHTTFLEPCVGTGNVINAMQSFGVDRERWRTAEIDHGEDYFEIEYPRIDVCITNPPFSLFERFLEKSLNEANLVAYLMRTNVVGGVGRYDYWSSIASPTHIYVLSERPSFGLGKINPKTGQRSVTDSTEYAWFVWDRFGYCLQQAGIHWIPPRPAEIRRAERKAMRAAA